MVTTREILQLFEQDQGWGDDSFIKLFCQFVDKKKLQDEFSSYLAKFAREESAENNFHEGTENLIIQDELLLLEEDDLEEYFGNDQEEKSQD